MTFQAKAAFHIGGLVTNGDTFWPSLTAKLNEQMIGVSWATAKVISCGIDDWLLIVNLGEMTKCNVSLRGRLKAGAMRVGRTAGLITSISPRGMIRGGATLIGRPWQSDAAH